MPIPTVLADSLLYTSNDTIRTYLISGPTLKSEFIQYVEDSGTFIGYATGLVYEDNGVYLVEVTNTFEGTSEGLKNERIVYTPYDQLRIEAPSLSGKLPISTNPPIITPQTKPPAGNLKPNYWFIGGFILAVLLLLITVFTTISDSKDKNNTAKPKKTK